MFRNKIAGFWELLGNVAFVRLFVGRVITDTGDSFYYIGSMWLVWELTDSPFYTGLAGAAVQVPNALRFLVGPLVDRWRLRRILLGTQIVNAVGVLLIPLAAATGWLSVWLVLVLIPISNFVNNFVYPAQDAALPQLVGDDLLTRANSLFSTTTQTVDTVARAVAGALIAALGGAVTLFAVDAVTFIVAALLFVGVTVPATTQDDASEDSHDGDEADSGSDETDADEEYLAELRDGVAYLRGSALLAIVLGAMGSNLASVGATAVMPAFADSLAGPAAYGVLVAATGAGSLVGTGSGFLVEDHSFSLVMIVGSVVSGLLWVLAIAVPGVWPTAALLFAAGIPTGIFNVLFFSLVQSAVDDDYLGRISSLVTSLAMLMGPLGALLGGAVAGVFGTRLVLYAAGGTSIALGGYYLAFPRLRSLPPVADADAAALGLRSESSTTTGDIGTTNGYSSE